MSPHLSILREALAAPDALLAADAARLAGQRQIRPLIPGLIANARDSRFYSKVASIYALVQMDAREALPLFEALLADPNVPDDFYWTGHKGIRTAAAIALLQMGSRAGLPWLLELATERHIVFTRWYAPALLRLGLPELKEHLTFDALVPADPANRAGTFGTEPGALCMLCECLGLMEDPRAEGVLRDYLDHFSRYVRAQAARSLCQRRPGAESVALAAQAAAKHGTDWDRIAAAELGRDGKALATLAQNAPAAFERAGALDALSRCGVPETEAACAAGRADSDPYVRQCAVEASNTAAAPQLEALLKTEPAPRVRCALAAALF